MANEIQNLEDVLDEFIKKSKKVPTGATIGQVSKEQDEIAEQRALRKNHLQKQQAAEKEQKVKETGVRDSIYALRKNAKSVLDTFVANTPKVKELKQRIEVLKEGVIKYTKLGDKESADKCRAEIKELQGMVKKYDSAVRNKTKEEREEVNEKVASDETFIKLSDEIETIKEQIKLESPTALSAEYLKLYKIIVSDKLKKDETDDNEDELFDIEDEEIFDEDALFSDAEEIKLTKKADSKHHQRFDELIAIIADRIDVSEKEVLELSPKDLKNLLKQSSDSKKLNELKNRLKILKTQRNVRQQQIKGYQEITDIMFQIFDYEDIENEPIAKNVIASRMVDYVCNIGYSLAEKFNMLHYQADIVSYGLLKLAECINKWYEEQKLINSPLGFQSFMGNFVKNAMQGGIAELTHAGVISGTNYYTQLNIMKKQLEVETAKIQAENPNLSEDMCRDIAERMQTADLANSSTMSEMADTISRGSKDSDEVDPYNFINDTISNDKESPSDTKFAYNELAKLLNDLLDETVPKYSTRGKNKGSVIRVEPLFDKYEKRGFMLLFGFEKKVDPETGLKVMYTQDEIGELIAQMYRENGEIDKTISGSAANTRKAKIIEKIQFLIQEKPQYKEAFKYIYQTMIDNQIQWRILASESHDTNYQDYFKPKNLENDSKKDDINVDLNLVLGEVDDYSDVFELSNDWTAMVDFTGLKF